MQRKIMHEIVDFTDPLTDIPLLLYRYKKHNVIRYNDYYYAVPYSLGAVDISDAKQRSHPEIISYNNRNKIHKRIDQLENTRPIEFAGWLPCFYRYGNCGKHPQFYHINTAPRGYRFTYSKSYSKNISLKKRLRQWIAYLACFVFIIEAALKFMRSARVNGAKLVYIFKFLITRSIRSQLLLRRKQNLVFLPSVPYTFGQYPWVIELEDSISFLYPFYHNGRTASVRFKESPYFPIFKTLIESNECRGIITHIKSTAESLPKLFNNDKLSSKITYLPLGVKTPAVFRDVQKDVNEVNLLFSNSWHQSPRSFFLRGGLELLSAFDELCKSCSNISLTLRTPLPALNWRYIEIIRRNRVLVLDKFLLDHDWEELIKQSDIYVLPSARIHAVSMLEAMSYGLVVVASDGWGVEEYIQHGKNGMIVKGRYGKVTWMDEKTGMLREDYEPMFREDPEVVKGLVEVLSSLLENKDLIKRIGQQARRDIETKYNLENWNRGLKTAFDKALGRNDMT